MEHTTIFVVGLGLIGGSIALNLQNNKHSTVIGFDGNAKTLDYAMQNQIIDQQVTSFEEGVSLADIVFLATPTSITRSYIQQLEQMKLKKELIVTDVCSVKKPVMETAESLTNQKVVFVGGHPMAGSHKNGIEAAKAHLFENAYYLFIPGTHACEEHVSKLEKLLSSTRSYFVTVDVEAHDQMTGVISHFPHLIASALVHQARSWHDTHPFLHELAAGGFRDITRIASSHPKMWNDIFFQNRETMISLLSDWIHEMDHLKSLVETLEHDELHTYLEQAKQYRDGLPVKQKGAIPSFYDLYVDIHDQPGALSEVTHIVAQETISIVNIQILEIREGISGALRLSFQTAKDQKHAQMLLQSNGYEVTIE
ncbi:MULTISPECIES: prephenate dehydrogenase [Pontibacillus]|uniref:Prephenate dehydrogenase n=1 Tax=Pontibacillus chungwhensis TaxID=265426 RepID=A0ABY8UST1_9BACI|nr:MULTISPECIES: prephenate dehydrogenase [Pontibacillus]MCD5322986.1 prephenate dehydrogenase [Pontibacillus sp. HN14]WIF96380.1 prephenate dehydrogenase [Pontibacillus chungwhensis]